MLDHHRIPLPSTLVHLYVLLIVLLACAGPGSVADVPSPPTNPPPVTTARPAPARVLLGGDSVMGSLVPALKAALGRGGQADVRFMLIPALDQDAALRAAVERQLSIFDPDVVVLFVGVWETGQIERRYGVPLTDPSWQEPYEREVLDPWLQLVTARGAEVLWIGNPPVPAEIFRERFAGYEEVLRRLPARWPRVRYLSSSVALNGTVGPEVHDVITGTDGIPIRTRQTDGLHLCPDGAARLAAAVAAELVPTVRVRSVDGWEAGPWRQDAQAFPPEQCPNP